MPLTHTAQALNQDRDHDNAAAGGANNVTTAPCVADDRAEPQGAAGSATRCDDVPAQSMHRRMHPPKCHALCLQLCPPAQRPPGFSRHPLPTSAALWSQAAARLLPVQRPRWQQRPLRQPVPGTRPQPAARSPLRPPAAPSQHRCQWFALCGCLYSWHQICWKPRLPGGRTESGVRLSRLGRELAAPPRHPAVPDHRGTCMPCLAHKQQTCLRVQSAGSPTRSGRHLSFLHSCTSCQQQHPKPCTAEAQPRAGRSCPAHSRRGSGRSSPCLS